jgi:hypothetical protein
MVKLNSFKPYIPLIISLLLAVFLFLVIKDFIRTVILIPLLHVLWFLSMILESIPQGVIWAVFILGTSMIAYGSLKREKDKKYPLSHTSTQYIGPVGKWMRLLERAQDDSFTKWRMAKEFKRLNRKLFSPIDEEQDSKGQKDWDLPPEINALFEAYQPTNTAINTWVDPTDKNSANNQKALDLDPEVVIQYFEKRLRT